MQVTNKKSGVTTPLSISWGWFALVCYCDPMHLS